MDNVQLKSLRLRERAETAAELLQLGLTRGEVAEILECSARHVSRMTQGMDVAPTGEPPVRLKSRRARIIWRQMLQQRANYRRMGIERLEARVLRLTAHVADDPVAAPEEPAQRGVGGFCG